MVLMIYWSFILAAGCYTCLAIWRLAIARTHPGSFYLAVPFLGMSIWSMSPLMKSALVFPASEFIRDLSWIGYIYYCSHPLGSDKYVATRLNLFTFFLSSAVIIRTILSYYILSIALFSVDSATFSIFLLCMRWIFTATSIFYINFLYRTTTTVAGSSFRLILVLLGVMWLYDLNIFTLILMGYPQAVTLSDFRGMVALALLPAFAIGARRKEHWKITLSRQAATQSILLLAIGAYFVVLASATRAAVWAGESTGDAFKIILATALTLIVVSLVLSPRLRAHGKTFFIKHFFEHRYDYRSEWLRFSATIADRGSSLLSTEERVIRSLADITQSQGGVLFLVEPANKLIPAGSWQYAITETATQYRLASPGWLADLAHSSRILKLDDIRRAGGPSTEDGSVPQWLIDETDLWIVIPLIRSQTLIGLAALCRPLVDRDLDWEDFDLIKVIAQQVAVHLSDAQSHAELEDARRFDEFNRRFAFIVHDIKNVVSQLSLVSSNAAEHGANPKFQASMIKTLANATTKMTTLLSRLSPDRMAAEAEYSAVEPERILRRLAEQTPTDVPIVVRCDCNCQIWVDEERLLEALGHLLSNAIEASPDGSPIQLGAKIQDNSVIISLEDQGCGMSANFIRKELFKPFYSTKPGGFGIGAAEARSIVLAMDGVLDVFSIEGKGTKFSATFPIFTLREK